MRKVILAAGALSGLIAVGAHANTGAPDPTLAPLSYAGPKSSNPSPFKLLHGQKHTVDSAREYRAERVRLLRKYLALEEENGGTLSPVDLAAMRSDIAEMKARYLGN